MEKERTRMRQGMGKYEEENKALLNSVEEHNIGINELKKQVELLESKLTDRASRGTTSSTTMVRNQGAGTGGGNQEQEDQGVDDGEDNDREEGRGRLSNIAG